VLTGESMRSGTAHEAAPASRLVMCRRPRRSKFTKSPPGHLRPASRRSHAEATIKSGACLGSPRRRWLGTSVTLSLGVITAGTPGPADSRWPKKVLSLTP